MASELYLRNATSAFKCMTGCAPDYLSDPFVKRGANYITARNSHKLNIPLFKGATGQRTFYYRIVSLWNSLESRFKLSQ